MGGIICFSRAYPTRCAPPYRKRASEVAARCVSVPLLLAKLQQQQQSTNLSVKLSANETICCARDRRQSVREAARCFYTLDAVSLTALLFLGRISLSLSLPLSLSPSLALPPRSPLGHSGGGGKMCPLHAERCPVAAEVAWPSVHGFPAVERLHGAARRAGRRAVRWAVHSDRCSPHAGGVDSLFTAVNHPVPKHRRASYRLAQRTSSVSE
ncbi:hypothetical protein FN846DRAFT_522861 [Sphaerosporella brunnea]|uniref:Uncharacterized protein n=1 Tax=Sphaerosporella brunnea TaxID=1250544 RepID=A0A5J5EFH8_9PEZI|nr:hypothetical protein FN846DRAFT_522861 [Sphaerosporella brunnea]